jgi:hypothetical protein
MKALMVICLSACTGQASAEGGCPPGEVPYNTPAARQCVPMGGGSSYSSGSVWERRWGALAEDFGASGSAGTGLSANAVTKWGARRLALKQCRATGGKDCKIWTYYFDQCAALARGDVASSYATDMTIELATETAMQRCNRGGSGCRIERAECSDPVRIQ